MDAEQARAGSGIAPGEKLLQRFDVGGKLEQGASNVLIGLRYTARSAVLRRQLVECGGLDDRWGEDPIPGCSRTCQRARHGRR